MNDSIQTISLLSLSLAFVPVLAVIAIHYAWAHDVGNKLYALSRMLVQLLLIGYVLSYIFEADNAWIVLAVLIVMVLVSSWIALRTVPASRRRLYGRALLSIALGGGLPLLLITQGVLQLEPWYRPSYLIPLAGMIFANAMNSMTLAIERFDSEIKNGAGFIEARNRAYRASLIPITNSLFAVGLVFLPGIMTGQILSGVSPLIAARYQIMVMCMTFASAGLASACFLQLLRRHARLFAADAG